MNRQLLVNTEKEIEVVVSSEKYSNVISNIFTNVRERVYEQLDGKPLINLKAKEVYFEDIKLDKKEERFLFLFWPRTKTNYTIKARVIVVIDYLDLKGEDIK